MGCRMSGATLRSSRGPRTPLPLPPIGLGTAMFGTPGGPDGAAAHRLLDAYVELGGSLIDTADAYAGGESERIIGAWLRTRTRSSVTIATKVGIVTGREQQIDLSPQHIRSACDASLRRLGTDHIDLYQAHFPDDRIPLEETVGAFGDLIAAGKVRHFGICNFPAWMLVGAHLVAEVDGGARPRTGQYLYNLIKRDVEADVLPACRATATTVIAWAPLAGGMLTGKYRGHRIPPAGSRFADASRVTATQYGRWQQEGGTVVAAVSEVAARLSVTATLVSLAWLLAQQDVGSVVAGFRTVDQLREAMAVTDWRMDAPDARLLASTSQPSMGYTTDPVGYTWPGSSRRRAATASRGPADATATPGGTGGPT